jgi:phage terminase Nu1 subunit (DNA packaging protein)
MNSTKKQKAGLVDVSKIAELFGISERAVQRLVIYDGMPRVSRGEYDLLVCSKWYVKYLHAMACGCATPCNGFDTETRAETNARAERRKALKEIADDLASELVGKKSDAIRTILAKAIDEAYK